VVSVAGSYGLNVIPLTRAPRFTQPVADGLILKVIIVGPFTGAHTVTPSAGVTPHRLKNFFELSVGHKRLISTLQMSSICASLVEKLNQTRPVFLNVITNAMFASEIKATQCS